MEVFFICFVLFLVGMMMWGIINALQQDQQRSTTGIRTTGTVVRNEIRWGRTTVVRPVVRFQLRSGQMVELLSKNGVALAIPQYSAGESVQVVYNPADPSDFALV